MNVGVIGLGFMGSMHLKAYARIPDARIVAVADPKPKRLAGDLSDVQGNIGGPGANLDFSRLHAYTAYEDLVADPIVEAVDICLPTHLHFPVALAALQAGKHVLVEKPMALTGEECDQMIAAAGQAGRVLMAAQVVRFWPDYAAARELLCAGGLGALRCAVFHRKCAAPAWSRWLKDAAKSGGGVFDLLIHDVDFCHHLFGPPAAVTAYGPEDLERGIDWAAAHLEYPHQAPVMISGGWHHPKSYPFAMDFTIVTDGGTLDFHSAIRRLTLYRADGTEEKPPLPEMDGYEAELRYFLECARANRWPEKCRPQDSAAAVRTALAINESRRGRGRIVL
jgi:predicted dehydrogenase